MIQYQTDVPGGSHARSDERMLKLIQAALHSLWGVMGNICTLSSGISTKDEALIMTALPQAKNTHKPSRLAERFMTLCQHTGFAFIIHIFKNTPVINLFGLPSISTIIIKMKSLQEIACIAASFSWRINNCSRNTTAYYDTVQLECSMNKCPSSRTWARWTALLTRLTCWKYQYILKIIKL